MTTPERTITALCQRSRDISFEKGWLNPDGTDPRPPATVFLLFVSEVSEAFEDFRNNKPLNETYYEVKIKEDDGSISKHNNVLPPALAELKKLDSKYGRGREFLDAKPCGIPIELADVVIRICQWSGSAKQADWLQAAFNEAVKEGELDDSSVDVVFAQAIKHLVEYHEDASVAYPDPASVAESLGWTLALLFKFSEKHSIDLWAAVDEKEAYNRTRPIRHGNKAC